MPPVKKYTKKVVQANSKALSHTKESLMNELFSDEDLEISFVKEDPLIGLRIQGCSKEIQEVELNTMIKEESYVNSRNIYVSNNINQAPREQGHIDMNNKKVKAAMMQTNDGRIKEDKMPFNRIPAENGASEDILSRHDRILQQDMMEVIKIKKKILERNKKKTYILHERILPVVKRDLKYKKMIYGDDYIGYNKERVNFITKLYNGDKYRAKAFLKKYFKNNGAD